MKHTYLLLFMAMLTATTSMCYSQNADLQKWINNTENRTPKKGGVYSGLNKVETGLSSKTLSKSAVCGMLPIVNGKVNFAEVVEANGVTATQLYTNARSWVAKNFVNAQNVIQMDDPISNKIILKASCPISKDGQYFYYTMKIECREGRYRYEISDFYMQGFKAGIVPKVFKESFETYYNKCDCQKKIHQKELTIIKRNVNLSIIGSLKEDIMKAYSSNNDW